MTRPTAISLRVSTKDPETITRAVEALSRAAAGLALENVDAFLIITEDEDQ